MVSHVTPRDEAVCATASPIVKVGAFNSSRCLHDSRLDHGLRDLVFVACPYLRNKPFVLGFVTTVTHSKPSGTSKWPRTVNWFFLSWRSASFVSRSSPWAAAVAC